MAKADVSDEDRKRVMFTFFVPPLDDDDPTNEQLRKKIKECGRFAKGGAMYRTRETYDTYRNGCAFPLFHFEDDFSVVQNYIENKSLIFPKYELGDGIEVRQGIYHEMARVRLPAYNPAKKAGDLSYITLAYKSLEAQPNRALLDNWKTWTGARNIMLDLGDSVPIQEVLFYVREFPADFDLFAHVVLMSFETSEEVRATALYYIQRLRVERWFGYATLYAVAPSFKRQT